MDRSVSSSPSRFRGTFCTQPIFIFQKTVFIIDAYWRKIGSEFRQFFKKGGFLACILLISFECSSALGRKANLIITKTSGQLSFSRINTFTKLFSILGRLIGRCHEWNHKEYQSKIFHVLTLFFLTWTICAVHFRCFFFTWLILTVFIFVRIRLLGISFFASCFHFFVRTRFFIVMWTGRKRKQNRQCNKRKQFHKFPSWIGEWCTDIIG